MKRRPNSFRLPHLNSFTLVELLVVMGIIAILAAVSMQVGISVIKAAKATKAANTAVQIQTACLGYYTEYSVYPVPASTTTDFLITDAASSSGSQTAAWPTLIGCLCGNLNPYNGTTVTPSITNSRGIAFLSMKASDVDSYGTPVNPLSQTVSNGTTNYFSFNIALDADYDGIVGDSGSAVGKLPNFVSSTGTTINYYTTGGPTAGVACWAYCPKTSSTNAIFYVHTY